MHIPRDIPILDEEYMKRKAKQRWEDAQREGWIRANRPSFLANTEEDDKQLFINGKITEEELKSRTEARWIRERKEANARQPGIIVLDSKKKLSPHKRATLKSLKEELIIVCVLAWLVGTLMEVAGGKILAVYIGFPIGTISLLLAIWITKTLRR